MTSRKQKIKKQKPTGRPESPRTLKKRRKGLKTNSKISSIQKHEADRGEDMSQKDEKNILFT